MTYPTTSRVPEFGTLILDLARHGVALPTAAQQLAFFETVLNRLPLEVAVLDTEGRYLYLNPDAVKNPEVRNWMIGKNDLEYCQHRGYDLEIAHTRRRYIETACRERQRVSFEEMFETPGGRKYHWRNYQPVCSASGELHFVLGFGRDITETRQVEAQLALSQKRVHGILENLTDAFFSLDHERRFTYLNTKAQQIFVHETDALLGRNLGEVFPRKEGAPPNNHWLRALSSSQPYVFEQFYCACWYEVHAYPTDEGLAVYLHDVSERRTIQAALQRAHDELEERVKQRTTELIEAKQRLETINKRLRHDAFHDSLTGLPNRAFFLERLDQAVAHARSQGFAVLFLDFNRFKTVNDSLGHAVGDALLRALGERLLGCVRPQDMVARLGGDEFTILLQGVQRAQAVHTAARIHDILTRPFCFGEHEIQISASIGIVPSELGYASADEVLRDADIAMYRAKLRGEAQHQLFSLSLRDEGLRQLALETDLRAALAHDPAQLEVAYQPITDMASGHLIGFEALVRWAHPTFGRLTPETFIPLAEETGLIVALDRAVLKRALAQVKAWQQQFPKKCPLTVSVNLSSRQFARPDLVGYLRDTLHMHAFDPRHLKLEITESVFMDPSEQTLSTLKQLRDLGVQLHLDDFGTGYSSLSYLQRLPISTLKIDRSFVTPISSNGRSAELVRAIVAMAKALGLKVTVEGIETAAQLEHLRRLGCEYGQGYLFARPLPPSEAETFIVQSLKSLPLSTPPLVLG